MKEGKWGGKRAGAGRPKAGKRGRTTSVYLYQGEEELVADFLTTFRSGVHQISIEKLADATVEREIHALAEDIKGLATSKQQYGRLRSVGYVPNDEALAQYACIDVSDLPENKEQIVKEWRESTLEMVKESIEYTEEAIDKKLGTIKGIIEGSGGEFSGQWLKKQVRRVITFDMLRTEDKEESDSCWSVLDFAYMIDIVDETKRQKVRKQELEEFKADFAKEGAAHEFSWIDRVLSCDREESADGSYLLKQYKRDFERLINRMLDGNSPDSIIIQIRHTVTVLGKALGMTEKEIDTAIEDEYQRKKILECENPFHCDKIDMQ